MKQGATTLTKPKYTKLVKDIRALIEGGKERAQAAVANELVETYWQVGRRISEEGLTDNAGYSSAVLENLAQELVIDYSTLLRSIKFFHTYNLAPRSQNLTWSHYKNLIPIENDEERGWYTELAQTEGFTRDQLASAIKRSAYTESKKSKKGATKRVTQTITRPSEPTYLYKAKVEKVVDGDTLLLKIDLGFAVFKEQRIRLSSIDAPEKETPQGKEACEFVLDALAQVPFVMVKTNKVDIYGRYVGDVFYSVGETDKNKIFLQGKYLNQELLNRGLAKVI